MKNLYICHTPYHLLISVIKQLLSREESDLLLCDTSQIGDAVVHRLEEAHIFSRITAYDKLDRRLSQLQRQGKNPFKWNAVLCRQLEAAGMDSAVLEDARVFIFNDSSVPGYWLNLHRKPYHLIEDGLDCYKNNLCEVYVPEGRRWKRALKILLGIQISHFGYSIYTKSIEINDAEGVHIRAKRKIKVVPRRELFARLSEDQRKRIVNIFFGPQELEALRSTTPEATLLITQPLSEDGITDDAKKLAIYRYLIRTYGTGTVYIKPHPRDTTDYEAVFPECKVIRAAKVPLELFGFLENVRFQRGVTAFSTSIRNLDFLEEKIVMGEDWVKAFSET